MNRVFEYNGTFVSPSNPGKTILKTVKRNLIIDSADRDLVKYERNGEFTVFLPKVYENIISVRLAAAEFPNLSDALVFTKATGPPGVALSPVPTYFLIELGGMNKSDECAINANRSGYLGGAVLTKSSFWFQTAGCRKRLIPLVPSSQPRHCRVPTQRWIARSRCY